MSSIPRCRARVREWKLLWEIVATPADAGGLVATPTDGGGPAGRIPVRYEAVRSGGRPCWLCWVLVDWAGDGRRTGSRRTNASSHCSTFGRYSLTTSSTDELSPMPSSILRHVRQILKGIINIKRYNNRKMRQFRTKHYIIKHAHRLPSANLDLRRERK